MCLHFLKRRKNKYCKKDRGKSDIWTKWLGVIFKIRLQLVSMWSISEIYEHIKRLLGAIYKNWDYTVIFSDLDIQD